MHELHGYGSNFAGEDLVLPLALVPEVLISDAECVPICINKEYFWLVVDTLDTLSSNFATIANPADEGEGTFDAIEVSVQTGVKNIEDLFRILPKQSPYTTQSLSD